MEGNELQQQTPYNCYIVLKFPRADLKHTWHFQMFHSFQSFWNHIGSWIEKV